jgi:hypothetical protein
MIHIYNPTVCHQCDLGHWADFPRVDGLDLSYIMGVNSRLQRLEHLTKHGIVNGKLRSLIISHCPGLVSSY